MINREKCYFCGLEAGGLPYRHKAEVGISCKRCGDYYIDDLLVECKDPSIKKFDAVLSGYTRWEKERGNPTPEIHAQNIDEITSNYKDLTIKEKVDRILLYYSGKSQEKGEYLNYDTKMDYPVAFSKGSDEFWYLLNEEARKTFGYIDIKARDILTITPKGWRKVDWLERVILADEKFKIECEKIMERISKIEADMKEQAGLEYGNRYSSVLARQICEVYLQGSLEKLDKKLETDKEIVIKTAIVSQSDDINFLIRRVNEQAEKEKKSIKESIALVYKDCHAENYFKVDLIGYMEKISRRIKEIEINLVSGKPSREEVSMGEDKESKMSESISSVANPKKIFVVHGRNEKARRAMFEFLRSIDIQPIEWGEAIKATGKGAPYIGEILNTAFSIAQAIIVLFTGDELVKLRGEYLLDDDPEYEKVLTPQARTNVIFEAGLAFGTHPDRTILVQLMKEKTKPFSDIYGRHFVKLSNETASRFELISKLKTAKCYVNFEHKKDWMTAGDFDGAVIEYRQSENNESK